MFATIVSGISARPSGEDPIVPAVVAEQSTKEASILLTKVRVPYIQYTFTTYTCFTVFFWRKSSKTNNNLLTQASDVTPEFIPEELSIENVQVENNLRTQNTPEVVVSDHEEKLEPAESRYGYGRGWAGGYGGTAVFGIHNQYFIKFKLCP